MLCAVLACMALCAGSARAQTRAECEEGIRFIRDALARTTEAAPRATLTQALRDAERELGEGEYDECLEAVEDAKLVMAGKEPPPRAREAPEYLSADEGLPVTVEDAFVPRQGEIEAKAGFIYDRVRRQTTGEDDEDPRRTGRNRYRPWVEVEAGVLPGLSLTLGTEYRFGDADDTKNGEVEVGGKWNFLGAQGWWPALALSASVSLPYGYDNDSTETTLSLLGSMPLGEGDRAPYLHANLSWSHAFKIEEGDRRDLFAGVLGIAVPVAPTTGLIFDVVREQESERGRYSNLAEVGIRHMLPGDLILAAGAGVGFGNSDTDFRALVGIQKSF
jgi:hypothetical protein